MTTGSNLTEEKRGKFVDLEHQFLSLFTEALSTADLVQHYVKLTSCEPVKSKPYPVAYSLRESLKEDIDDMIKMGVIRESNSPYASPVVFLYCIVKKKDGTIRVCLDYRKLNKLIVFEPDPMPTAD